MIPFHFIDPGEQFIDPTWGLCIKLPQVTYHYEQCNAMILSPDGRLEKGDLVWVGADMEVSRA